MASEAIGQHDPALRRLSSSPLARRPWMPVPIRLFAGRRELMKRSELEFGARSDLLRYGVTRAVTGVPSVPNDVIWQYWGTGAQHAPPIVQRCVASVAACNPDRRIVVLDDASIAEHVTLPDWIVDKRDLMGPTHFSDVLRVALLAEHGGTWIDATVLMSDVIPADLSSGGFFAFTRPEDPFLLSSWFIQSTPGSPLVVALREALYGYWETRSALRHYFQLHFMFEACVVMNQELRAVWLVAPFWDHRPPHQLQEVLLEPFDSRRLAQIFGESWIHKLTWKIDSPDGGTFFDHLVSGGGF